MFSTEELFVPPPFLWLFSLSSYLYADDSQVYFPRPNHTWPNVTSPGLLQIFASSFLFIFVQKLDCQSCRFYISHSLLSFNSLCQCPGLGSDCFAINLQLCGLIYIKYTCTFPCMLPLSFLFTAFLSSFFLFLSFSFLFLF